MAFKDLCTWEVDLFKHVDVPVGVTVPVSDEISYLEYPDLRWVFNRVELCKSQNIDHGLTNVEPSEYPVYVKPITGLFNKTDAARKINDIESLVDQPGFFWMEYFEGPHVKTDVVILNNKPVWWGHSFCRSTKNVDFEMWEFRGSARMDLLEKYLTKWIGDFIESFTGVFNFETLGNKIINAHPHLSPQFVNLYHPEWLPAVVNLYSNKKWEYSGAEEIGYSAIIWSNDFKDLKILEHKMKELRSRVLSIQVITEEFFKPAFGYKLGIANSREKEDVFDVVRCIKSNITEQETGWWEKFRKFTPGLFPAKED